MNYTLRMFFKEMTFSLMVNNVFNELYENNGYTWGYVYEEKELLKISISSGRKEPDVKSFN